jgi:cell division protein FtsW (lipid II flippase)
MRFSEWLQHNWFVVHVNGSVPTASSLEIIHYVGFFLVVGATAIMDLRVMGVAGKRQSATQLAEQVFPWMWTGLVLAVISGFLMYASDATEYLHNSVFHAKLFWCALAVIFAVVVRLNVSKWDKLPAIPLFAKIIAFISLVLWIKTILEGVNVPALTGVG